MLSYIVSIEENLNLHYKGDKSNSKTILLRTIDNSTNSVGWRLGQKLVDFEQKHGNPTMDLLQ